MNTLWGALVGKGRWDFKNNRSNMCEWISDYEMAQLRAYWGPNRTCWKWVNASLDLWDFSSVWSEVKWYSKEKKSKNEQKDNLSKNITSQNKNLAWLSSYMSTQDRKLWWSKMFWDKIGYNSNFSFELNADFENIFEEVMGQYWQSLENAISSDVSDLVSQGDWLLRQVNTTMNNTSKLKDVLQKIVDKQCSG
jgi:hypothetical protein